MSREDPIEAGELDVLKVVTGRLAEGASLDGGPPPVRDLFFTSVTRAVLTEAPVPVMVGA
jgi:nucleotide-binding universal stress UspA family protein